MRLKAEFLDKDGIRRSVVRISHEMTEKNPQCENLCLVGIKTRGVPLSNRIAKSIEKIENHPIEVGEIDITLYRDDLAPAHPDAVVNGTSIPFSVTGKTVVLVDDVIYTGRTAHAAMNALLALGRPASIQLAILIDRGHREFPIRPDYVGKNIPTSRAEIVQVNLSETDGEDSVKLFEK